MFDTIGAFKKQFTRIEDGYLVYPSRKIGGKPVSDEEYEQLVTEWERVAGRTGRWKAVGAVVAVIAVWTLLSDSLSAPEWADALMITIIVMAMSGWLFWASTAPRRLVRDRAPVAPPRRATEARREARAALSWPFIVFALLFSGAAFFSSVTAAERTIGTWAWLIGSGAMLGLYLGIGFKKLMDARR